MLEGRIGYDCNAACATVRSDEIKPSIEPEAPLAAEEIRCVVQGRSVASQTLVEPSSVRTFFDPNQTGLRGVQYVLVNFSDHSSNLETSKMSGGKLGEISRILSQHFFFFVFSF